MDLFVYGTLLDPEIFFLVTGQRPQGRTGVLEGYERRLVQGEMFPAIIARNGAMVSGLVYPGISQAVMTLLDQYEGTLYKRREVEIRLDDHSVIRAQTYILAEGAAHLLSQHLWSLDEFKKKYKKLYLESI